MTTPIYAVHNGSVTALTLDDYLHLDVVAAEAAGCRFAWRPETATLLALQQATEATRRAMAEDAEQARRDLAALFEVRR